MLFVELAEDLIHRHGLTGRHVRQPFFDGHHRLGQSLVGADTHHFAQQRREITMTAPCRPSALRKL
jgi:hypothetical protein